MCVCVCIYIYVYICINRNDNREGGLQPTTETNLCLNQDQQDAAEKIISQYDMDTDKG